MGVSAIYHVSAGNEWGAIFPELLLGCLALLLLVLEVVLPKDELKRIPEIAILGQLGILAGLFFNFHSGYLGRESFNGLLIHSPAGQVMRVFFLISSILVC